MADLEKIVDAAVTDDTEVEEVEEVEDADEAEAEAEAEEEIDEEGLTKAEAKEARNLYKLLKDKDSQENTIRILATKAGILTPGHAPETPKEVKAAKKDLKTILKDGLGPEYYGLLGDKLEKVLEQVIEQQTASQEDIRIAQTESKVDAAFDKLASETKGESNKFKARMSQLADELQMAPGTSVERYIRQLYTLASSERKASTTGKQIADRINRNANNAADRIASAPRGGSSGNGNRQMAEAPKGLKAIVSAAMESVVAGRGNPKK